MLDFETMPEALSGKFARRISRQPKGACDGWAQ